MNLPKLNETKMKQLIISLGVLSLAMTVLAFFGVYKASCYKSELKGALSTSYGRAVSAGAKSLADLENSLDRWLASSSRQGQKKSASRAYECSLRAKANLDVLPHSEERLFETERFLESLGRFSLEFMLREDDSSLGDERERLVYFRDGARELARAEERLKSRLRAEEMGYNLGLDFDRELRHFDDAEELFREKGYESFEGRFFDYQNPKKSFFLEGFGEATEEEAREAGAKALGIKPNSLTKMETENSSLPAFVFSNENSRVAVTKKGGFVSYFLTIDEEKPKTKDELDNNKEERERAITKAKAVMLAEEKLELLGYKGLKPTHYQLAHGVMTIFFAHRENDVVCYTDMISVSISLETGKALSFDARKYLLSHRERDFSSPSLTESDARGLIGDGLKEISLRQSLIPAKDGKELFCYELILENSDKERFITYLNASSGKEEAVYLLREGEKGMYAL